ncbi:MAG: alpha-L-rhamnosidase C-terminal domain-containing protein, partial [Victivallales bacterium]|nr:alpha-L-rhamnosidase C-terminal domain-containing protein [Victivallales bacterium]
PNIYSQNQPAGLFGQLEITAADGQTVIIGSDETWRVKHHEAYCRDVDIVNIYQGTPNEIYDANREINSWQCPDYDDSNWEMAAVTEDYQWRYLEPRMTPQLKERKVFPKRLVRCGEVGNYMGAFSEKQIPERLTYEENFPLKKCLLKFSESLLSRDGVPVILQSKNINKRQRRDPFLVLDFGKPCLGNPYLEFDDVCKGTVIEITYGIDLKKDGTVNGCVSTVGWIPCDRFGDRYIARDGKQSWELFEPRLVRYLQIVIRSAEIPVKLKSVMVNVQEYPVEQTGHFECSDSVLTQLWNAGINTVYLHMEDVFAFDAVRERRAFVLHGEVEQCSLAMSAAFGDQKIIDQGFRHAVRRQLPNGMTGSHFMHPRIQKVIRNEFPHYIPVQCNPGWCIPNYDAFYAQAVRNHYRYFPKNGFLEENYPALVKIATWAEGYRDATSDLYWNLPSPWLDWIKNDLCGAAFGINALYVKMYDDMAETAKILGYVEDAERWHILAHRTREALRRLHWNKGKELYTDSVHDDGEQSSVFTELSNAMAILYDIATEDQIGIIAEKLTKPEKWIEAESRVSPLYFYYVVEALLKAGKTDYALRYMSGKYEPVLKGSDFPTLCEYWDEQSGSIHGGGSGVVWTLSTHVLGISPTENGFQTVRIRPETGLLTWARGTLPADSGKITVDWKKDKMKFVISITLPENVIAEVILPKKANRNIKFVHNGKSFRIGSADKHFKGITLTSDTISLKVKGSKHTFTVEEL